MATGEVCCHWSLGSGRILPYGLFRQREGEEGRPIIAPGVDLTTNASGTVKGFFVCH